MRKSDLQYPLKLQAKLNIMYAGCVTRLQFYSVVGQKFFDLSNLSLHQRIGRFWHALNICYL